MRNHEIAIIHLKKGAYEKPERTNQNIPAVKYDNIDKSCESVCIGDDGNAYMPESGIPKLINKDKKKSRYIVDNKISEEHKHTINNKLMINTSGLVGYLDQNSHQTRNAEEADLNRYARESLTRIGDSDQAESERRKIDAKVSKMLPRLRSIRGGEVDEITGEPLQKGASFHHVNNKEIYNNPNDVIDPEQGINVNSETHKEIHGRGIVDKKELERQSEDIKTVLNRRK